MEALNLNGEESSSQEQNEEDGDETSLGRFHLLGVSEDLFIPYFIFKMETNKQTNKKPNNPFLHVKRSQHVTWACRFAGTQLILGFYSPF